MSLLDAFVEEGIYDYPVCKKEFHIALRTDGATGTGSEEDPYNGSDQTKLDAKLRYLAGLSSTSNPISIRFGPGQFPTGGYPFNSGMNTGWAAASGMRISGVGAGKTTLVLIRSDLTLSAAVVGNTFDASGFLNGFEISDISLNAGGGDNILNAASGLFISGRNILVQRVQVDGLAAKSNFTAYGILAVRTFSSAPFPVFKLCRATVAGEIIRLLLCPRWSDRHRLGVWRDSQPRVLRHS